MKSGCSRLTGLETSELIAVTEKHSGQYHVLEEEGPKQKLTRIAVFTITREELENLREFGDVLFLDGTQIPNKLCWQCFPITVVDSCLSIRCAGVLFAARGTGDIFTWLLAELLSIMEKCRKKIETIVTDEDLAIVKALGEMNEQRSVENKIEHVICFWHKRKNFENKLSQLKLRNEVKEHARYLFERIGRCAHRDVVQKCVQELKTISPQLDRYVSKHLEPLLHQFSRAYIQSFTYGYNVSSLAESTNAMIKSGLTARNYTLAEIRQEIIDAFNHKQAVQRYEELNKRANPSILETRYGVKVSEKVRVQLLGSLLKAFRLIDNGDSTYTDPKHPDETYSVFYPHCECRKMEISMLPCSHLMRYSIDHEINPCKLVSTRYRQSTTLTQSVWHADMSNAEEIKKEARRHGATLSDQEELIEPDKPRSKVSVLKVLDAQCDSSEHDEGIRPVQPADDRTSVERFNLILAEAKEVARIAARDQDRTDELIAILKSKWRDYASVSTDEEVTEARGVTVGRPRLTRIRASQEGGSTRRRSQVCQVCVRLGCSAGHPQAVCEKAQRLLEIAKEGDQEEVGNICSICGGRGHNCRRCPNLEILKRELNLGPGDSTSEEQTFESSDTQN